MNIKKLSGFVCVCVRLLKEDMFQNGLPCSYADNWWQTLFKWGGEEGATLKCKFNK